MVPWQPVSAFRRIDLAGVTHRYTRQREERSFTLGPIDLTIRPGELLFLVGGNGSGKTTLGKLLAGLYAPETGEVRLDGVPVTDTTRPTYRERFAAVFSDGFLFDRLLGLAAPDLDRQILPELRARGKAVVVISHDDRYYDVADRLVKLESGRIDAETRPARAGAGGD